jgi:hypothetical protein
MSTTANDTDTRPLSADALEATSSMTNIERFLHLLQYTKLLVGRYGPYTTHRGTTVFTHALNPHPSKDPSTTDLALSLAAAQDSMNSAQPSGPANFDLDLFIHLWETTVAVLEEILARGSLPQEAFGWGIFGLSSGYMHAPANDVDAENLFEKYKYRLRAALLALPSMDGRRKSEYVVSEKTKITTLVKARRECHTIAHLLLHQFRQEQWRRVRWLHMVSVAEWWIYAFDLMPVEIGQKKREEEHRDVRFFPEKEVEEPPEKIVEQGPTERKVAPKLPSFSFP